MEGTVSANPPSGVAAGPAQASFTENRALRVQLVSGGSDVTPTAPFPVLAVGSIVTPSYNFTRPADTTPYSVGDLVANSTTAGSVVPMSWTAARVAAGSFYVRRVRLFKSTTTTTNAIFRIHLYSAAPSTIANGDNAAFLTAEAGYVGAFDVQLTRTFSDGVWGAGVPIVGAEVNVVLPSAQLVYGLIEARADYTPGDSEVFTTTLEVQQN